MPSSTGGSAFSTSSRRSSAPSRRSPKASLNCSTTSTISTQRRGRLPRGFRGLRNSRAGDRMNGFAMIEFLKGLTQLHSFLLFGYLVRGHFDRARFCPRVRSLPDRPLERGAGRGLFDRVRSGAVRLVGSSRDPLEIQHDPARRIREDVRRQRRQLGAAVRRARAARPGGARSFFSLQEAGPACRDRRGGADSEFSVRDRRAWPFCS